MIVQTLHASKIGTFTLQEATSSACRNNESSAAERSGVRWSALLGILNVPDNGI